MTPPAPLIHALRRRRAFHPVVRAHGLLLAYLVGAPTAYLLAKIVGWPVLLSALGLRRRQGGFGGYESGATDIIAAVYFKSGTTWTLQIAQQIAQRGRGTFAHIHDVVPWPDALRPGYAVPLDAAPASETGLRVIKTHLPADAVPWSEQARYLSVLRDPKEVAVSSYHFVKAVALGPMMPPVGIWLRWFLSPDFAWGSWAEHADSWWRRRDEPNVLVLRFDAMKADLPGAVALIAELLGVSLRPDEFAAVVRCSSFEAMRADEARFGPGAVTPWGTTQPSMIRRGQPGRSSELLSPGQQDAVDRWCRAELRRLGSDLPYDELFGPATRCTPAP